MKCKCFFFLTITRLLPPSLIELTKPCETGDASSLTEINGSFYGASLEICVPRNGYIICAGELTGMENTHPIAYADDLAILISGKSRVELERRGATAIEVVERWASVNKLVISKEKTTV